MGPYGPKAQGANWKASGAGFAAAPASDQSPRHGFPAASSQGWGALFQTPPSCWLLLVTKAIRIARS